MRRSGLWSVAALTILSTGALVGCGGGGHGFGVNANPVAITSTALPATLSGQIVDYANPFTGGAGGPYLLDVIDGALPSGVSTNANPPKLVGRALVDGVFDFTLRLTDTGSSPFSVSIQTYHWVIGVGSLVIATDTSLPPIIFNQFVSIPL